MWSRLSSYLNLTKPRILLLVGLTGAASLVLEESLLLYPLKFLLVMTGLLLAGGSANSFNQYFERERDALMERTRLKRPLPLHQLRPFDALLFSMITGVLSVLVFAFFFNWQSSILALSTILFYGLFYTLWLKPRTHLNIVIGGAAGAMAPVIAWVAASGSISWVPLVLFLVIFFWTPSHFWALAMCLKDDYRRVGLPMLPLVKGDDVAKKQILIYTVWTVALSLGLAFAKVGFVYILSALLLGGLFIYRASKLRQSTLTKPAAKLFSFSIIYLMLLFAALITDALLGLRFW